MLAASVLELIACSGDRPARRRDPDAAVSGAGLDARVDARPASDCLLVTGELTYFFDSGYAEYQTVSSVTAAGLFRRDRTSFRDPDAGVDSCVAVLPACDSEPVDKGDLSTALAAPDVESAFTTDETVVLGLDTRASDGAVLIVERLDGKRITIGYPCAVTGRVCTVIPEGVQRLADLLARLSDEQAAAGPCASADP